MSFADGPPRGRALACALAAGCALGLAVAPPALAQAQTSPAPLTAPASYGSLRGIVVLADPAQVKTKGATAQGLDLSRSGKIPRAAVRRALTPLIGRPVDLALLARIRTELEVALTRSGDRFDRVIVPPQDVTGGVVQVLVLRGKLGKLTVQGAKWFDASAYRREIRVMPGQPLDGGELDADVDWINRNPFRHAQLVATPGAQTGEADLTVKAADAPPLRVYSSYDNTGTSSTDYGRWNMGLNFGGLAGGAVQASYQRSVAPDFHSFDANAGSVTIALPWRDLLILSGSTDSVNSKLPPPLDQTGYSSTLGARYVIPLDDLGWLSNQDVSLAFDFKRSNNNLLFAQLPVFGDVTEIGEWTLSYAGSETDRQGSTSFAISAVWSPGGWFDHDNDAAYAGQRTGAHARFSYVNLQIGRTTHLPWNFSLVDSLQGQLSSGNLLGTEELAMGGAGAIRGYDPDQVYVDEGVISRNELRAPPLPLLRTLGLPVHEQLQPFVFGDLGQGYLHSPLLNEKSQFFLASSGLGLDYAIGKHFTLAFDYGWQLRNPDLGPRQRASRSDFSAALSW
ncbi:MAG TPA: ShlB/FhaC/HecB family hemolysin secretion/activation protein [Caulobacteraceae bacterium]|jgi:hemolysin activation/secretion protein|nr:ShlB/FhaC/HecB family hemolysin secretion/activation protein [Caulobacteraceae bacterium]